MSRIQYLNVDLDIESRHSLAPLLGDFDDDFDILNHSESGSIYRASIEVSGNTRDAESTINAFCDLIANLSPDAVRSWTRACKRQFNIGYQSGNDAISDSGGDRWFESVIHPSTLARINEVGAGIVITIYPPPE